MLSDWFRVKKNRLRRAGTHVLRVVKHRRPRIIVSMTSYPARINTVHLAIRSLLAQKVLPDKIVLWLCKSDFPNREADLPQSLRDVLWHDVEVRWVDNSTFRCRYLTSNVVASLMTAELPSKRTKPVITRCISHCR